MVSVPQGRATERLTATTTDDAVGEGEPMSSPEETYAAVA
jgi:hypothetical protein